VLAKNMDENLKQTFYVAGVATSSLIAAYALSNEVVQLIEFNHPENKHKIELIDEQNKNIQNVLDITSDYRAQIDSLKMRSIHHEGELKYLTANPLFYIHGKTSDELKEIHQSSLENILTEKQLLEDKIEGNSFVKGIYEDKISEVESTGYVSKDQRTNNRLFNLGLGALSFALFGHSLNGKNKK
jgi:hypothetical protein